MSDRELLELAAKAAGYTPAVVTDDGVVLLRGVRVKWSPRTDDGDSRRLEVALNISVTPGDVKCSASWWVRPSMIVLESVAVLTGDDKAASVRLAVLLAAAEIGKETP